MGLDKTARGLQGAEAAGQFDWLPLKLQAQGRWVQLVDQVLEPVGMDEFDSIHTKIVSAVVFRAFSAKVHNSSSSQLRANYHSWQLPALREFPFRVRRLACCQRQMLSFRHNRAIPFRLLCVAQTFH